MSLYTLKSQQDMAKMLSAPKYNPNSQNVYNAIGRDAGANAAETSSSSTSVWDNIGNFFKNRASDIENALGTTGAAIASPFVTEAENRAIEERQERWKKRLADVGKKYGFESTNDYWDKLDAAEASGNTEEYNRLNSMTELQDEIKRVAAENSAEAREASENWKDFRENNYIGKKINGQTNGQFAGSAINTLSTAADLTGLSVGPVGNAIQGAAEGLAEELKANGGNVDIFKGEASGWDNFSGEQAAKNAIVGAATGAATGALNKAINGKMLANGGNLFKGGNKLTQALNNAGSKTALGRGVSTIATGAGRGALSGAVGGATGAAVSSALNGEDVGTGISNALQGASNGIAAGGVIGGTMAGANMVANKIPGVNKITNLQRQSSKAVDDFQNSGDNFRERLSNTWNSGDSKVANMAQNWQSGGDNFRERLATTMDSFRTNSPSHFTQKNWGLDNVPEAEVATPEPVRVAQPTPAAEPLDNWDKIAREGGYENWDALEQRFMEANPNYKPTGNDAGAVLGWMDNNPGDYNPNARIATTNTQDTTSQEQIANAEKTLKTSRSEKLKLKAAQKLLDQYGTIDKPTAKSTNPAKTVQEIADAGLTKPGEVEMVANKITGTDGELPKLVKNMLASSGPVDTYSGENGELFDDYINRQIQLAGLDGINEGKAVKSQINATLKSLPSRAEGSIDFTDNAADVFDAVQKLESYAANYRGKSGMNYGTTTPDKLAAAKVLSNTASLLKNRVFDGADASTVVTPEVVSEMKSWVPNNKKWSDYVDNTVAQAKTGQDLRAIQAPWVRMQKIINNGYENSGTYGSRVGNAATLATALATKNPLKTVSTAAVDAVVNSKPGLRLQAAALNKAADFASNDTTPTTNASTTTSTTANTIPASMMLYNAIGRDNGEAANQFVLNGGSITPTANTSLEELSYNNPGSTSLYDSYYGTPATNTAYTGADLTQAGLLGIFGNTGNYNMDIIGGAMEMALMRGDSASFNELSSIYKMLGANLADSTSSNSSQTKLSVTQQRANAAMNSLQRLANMTPDVGYNLSGIPVVGDVATFGGNDYEGESKSLAQQIGYMVSGANIKPEEAYNIGKAYVPQPFDSKQTRELKLQRAYEIIRQYQNGYGTQEEVAGISA